MLRYPDRPQRLSALMGLLWQPPRFGPGIVELHSLWEQGKLEVSAQFVKIVTSFTESRGIWQQFAKDLVPLEPLVDPCANTIQPTLAQLRAGAPKGVLLPTRKY